MKASFAEIYLTLPLLHLLLVNFLRDLLWPYLSDKGDDYRLHVDQSFWEDTGGQSLWCFIGLLPLIAVCLLVETFLFKHNKEKIIESSKELVIFSIATLAAIPTWNAGQYYGTEWGKNAGLCQENAELFSSVLTGLFESCTQFFFITTGALISIPEERELFSKCAFLVELALATTLGILPGMTWQLVWASMKQNKCPISAIVPAIGCSVAAANAIVGIVVEWCSNRFFNKPSPDTAPLLSIQNPELIQQDTPCPTRVGERDQERGGKEGVNKKLEDKQSFMLWN